VHGVLAALLALAVGLASLGNVDLERSPGSASLLDNGLPPRQPYIP
jgi:hypothetical protein